MKFTLTSVIYLLFCLFFIGLFARSQYYGYRWVSGNNAKHMSKTPPVGVIMHK